MFFISCDNILPLPTRSGRNIFGCKVDGTTLKTSTRILRDNPISAGYDRDNVFYVSGNDFNNDLAVELDIRKLTKEGKYKLDNINLGFLDNRSYPKEYYETTKNHTGEVCITKLNANKRIISGTFWFEAVNRRDSTDVVKVSRGRFDIDLDKLK